MIQLTSMVMDGVFEVYPNLRVGYLEAGCGWMPYMMDRLDYEYEAIWGPINRIEDQIMHTPAHSFAGIAVKLRLALDHTEAGENNPEGLDWDQKLTFHALRDAERLAGESGS